MREMPRELEFEWFRNVLTMEQTKDGWVPRRFTDKQMKVYAQTESLALRSRCPAGVCLDVLTNASYIEWDYAIGRTARPWAYFDIYLDDVWAASLGCDDIGEDPGTRRYELPDQPGDRKMQRLTLYLPHNAELVLQAVRFPEGAEVQEAPRHARRILCLGDSITQGMDARRPSSIYPVLISRALDAELLNQGVGGYVFAEELLDAELPYRPDVITVAYGTNDWGRHESIASFERACGGFFAKLAEIYPSTPVYALTPLWRADQDKPRPLGAFADVSAAIWRVAGAYGNVTLIDGSALIPHRTELFGDAHLHPNEEGFLHMAMNMLQRIGKYELVSPL